MGLFDFVTFKGKLPDGRFGVTDQTKAFEANCMAGHEILEDGTLLIDLGQAHHVPLEERPHGDSENLGDQLRGCIRWEPCLTPDPTWTGVIGVGGYQLHVLRGKLQGFIPDDDIDKWIAFIPESGAVELPEWASGEGWEWHDDIQGRYALYIVPITGPIRRVVEPQMIAVDDEGLLRIVGPQFSVDVMIQFETPEKARRAADKIIATRVISASDLE